MFILEIISSHKKQTSQFQHDDMRPLPHFFHVQEFVCYRHCSTHVLCAHKTVCPPECVKGCKFNEADHNLLFGCRTTHENLASWDFHQSIHNFCKQQIGQCANQKMEMGVIVCFDLAWLAEDDSLADPSSAIH